MRFSQMTRRNEDERKSEFNWNSNAHNRNQERPCRTLRICPVALPVCIGLHARSLGVLLHTLRQVVNSVLHFDILPSSSRIGSRERACCVAQD